MTDALARAISSAEFVPGKPRALLPGEPSWSSTLGSAEPSCAMGEVAEGGGRQDEQDLPNESAHERLKAHVPPSSHQPSS